MASEDYFEGAINRQLMRKSVINLLQDNHLKGVEIIVDANYGTPPLERGKVYVARKILRDGLFHQYKILYVRPNGKVWFQQIAHGSLPLQRYAAGAHPTYHIGAPATRTFLELQRTLFGKDEWIPYKMGTSLPPEAPTDPSGWGYDGWILFDDLSQSKVFLNWLDENPWGVKE